MKHRPVIIISGPTACNKTKISLVVASMIKKQLNQEAVIVNFDSLLFYKELSVGTAKPSLEELNSHLHELISITSIKTPLNSADFVSQATQLINKHHQAHKIIILVGGSSFYIRALVKGMYDSPPISDDLKNKNQAKYKINGIQSFLEYLKEHDLDSYESLHANDHYRIIRAAEHHMMTGEQFSKQKKLFDSGNPYDFSINQHPDWDIFHIYLDIPKKEHQIIIQNRVKRMLTNKLIEEVQTLLGLGFTGKEKPINSVGYKEVLDFLSGKIKDRIELTHNIVISTRQLAKSQRTFFKKITPKNCYHGINDESLILSDVFSFLTQN